MELAPEPEQEPAQPPDAPDRLPTAEQLVASLMRVPASEAAHHSLWSSAVLLRQALQKGRKALTKPKWERRWLAVFPRRAVHTAQGPAQVILVYKSADASTPLEAHAVVSAPVEAHRKYDDDTRPPRFEFEIDSRGKVYALQWQLTFAVETAEAAEGWSHYWSQVSDGLSGADRSEHSLAARLGQAEPVRFEGTLGLRMGVKGKRPVPRWAVVRGPLLQFYESEAEARRAEADGRAFTRHAAVNGGKGPEAQEATVHLEHASVEQIAGKSGAPWHEFEVVSGSKSWRLEAADEEQTATWLAMLRGITPSGGSPSLAGSAAGGGLSEHDTVTVLAEEGETQLGISFARVFAKSLGTEYFAVQRIRGPDTVGAAAEPDLKLGMVLQSVNSISVMLMVAECGGRGDLASDALQRQLRLRPLALTFVRTPDMLRADMDAAALTVTSAPPSLAVVVEAPVNKTSISSGHERRLFSGTGAAVTVGGVAQDRSVDLSSMLGNGGAAEVTMGAAAGKWKRHGRTTAGRTGGGTTSGGGAQGARRMSTMSMASMASSMAQSSAGSAAGASVVSFKSGTSFTPSDKTPIGLARAHYGPWWSAMTQAEQQAAVAAAEQEQSLVAMGVMRPHSFEFHAGAEQIEAEAVARADRAASFADSEESIHRPVGNPWATQTSAVHSADGDGSEYDPDGQALSDTELVGGAVKYVGPATREFMVSVQTEAARVVAADEAEYMEGVRDARRQADELATMMPGSPAERWATRQVWLEVDADCSGTLDSAELAAVMRKLGLNAGPRDVEDAMTKVDENGNGTIEYNEFVVWYRRVRLKGEIGLGGGSANGGSGWGARSAEAMSAGASAGSLGMRVQPTVERTPFGLRAAFPAGSSPRQVFGTLSSGAFIPSGGGGGGEYEV